MLTENVEELCVCTYVESKSLTLTVENEKKHFVTKHVAISILSIKQFDNLQF